MSASPDSVSMLFLAPLNNLSQSHASCDSRTVLFPAIAPCPAQYRAWRRCPGQQDHSRFRLLVCSWGRQACSCEKRMQAPSSLPNLAELAPPCWSFNRRQLRAEEGRAGEWEPHPPRALLSLCLRKRPGPSRQALNNEGQSVVLTSSCPGTSPGLILVVLFGTGSFCLCPPSMEITDVCRHPQLNSSYLRGSEVLLSVTFYRGAKLKAGRVQCQNGNSNSDIPQRLCLTVQLYASLTI